MQHAWLVSVGTRSVILKAATENEARDRVIEAWQRVNGWDRLIRPDRSELHVRPARGGDFGTFDYWSGAARDETTLVRLFNPDEPVTG